MVKQLFYRFCRACARSFAQRHKPFVIGVTGSVGKTSCRMIVTEVLQQLFPQQRIVTSKKNFNSELWLALALLQIDEYTPTIRWTCKAVIEICRRMLQSNKPYDVIFLEYGIDYVGEMDIELSIVRPHIALFTMIDKVHAMQMGSMEVILAQKAKLLKAAKEVICVPLEMQEMLQQHLAHYKGDMMTYSFDENTKGSAKYAAYTLEKDAGGLPLATSQVTIGDMTIGVHTSLLGKENMWYIAVWLLIARLLGQRRGVADLLRAGEKYYFPLHLQDSRYSILRWKYESVLVDSSYNAAPQSMRKMLANVQELQQRLYPDHELRLCLGEMRELWTYTEDEHRKLMHELRNADRLYLLGESMLNYAVDELTREHIQKPTFKTFKKSQELWKAVEEDLSTSPKKVIILCKWSQNTIYLEEAVKLLLEDEEDAEHLCRQWDWRLQRKKQQGYMPLLVSLLWLLCTMSASMLMSWCSLRWEESHPIMQRPVTNDVSEKMSGKDEKKEQSALVPWESRGGTWSRACFGTACFWLEVADSPTERATGLMYRKSLAEDGGMVFVFDEKGNHSFWMKNTLIPLDMLRIGEDKKIIHIEHNVPPCKADPCPAYGSNATSARYVVELNAGISIHRSITTGMSVALDIVY